MQPPISEYGSPRDEISPLNSFWDTLHFLPAHHFIHASFGLTFNFTWASTTDPKSNNLIRNENQLLGRTFQQQNKISSLNHFRFKWFIRIGCVVHILLQLFISTSVDQFICII